MDVIESDVQNMCRWSSLWNKNHLCLNINDLFLGLAQLSMKLLFVVLFGSFLRICFRDKGLFIITQSKPLIQLVQKVFQFVCCF